MAASADPGLVLPSQDPITHSIPQLHPVLSASDVTIGSLRLFSIVGFSLLHHWSHWSLPAAPTPLMLATPKFSFFFNAAQLPHPNPSSANLASVPGPGFSKPFPRDESHAVGGLPPWSSCLRNHLPMQGTWVRSLIWEDSTCLGTPKPAPHKTTEPAL